MRKVDIGEDALVVMSATDWDALTRGSRGVSVDDRAAVLVFPDHWTPAQVAEVVAGMGDFEENEA